MAPFERFAVEPPLVTQRLWAERAGRTINCAFPSVEFSTWTVCERLLAQARVCAELINEWGFEFPEGADLLERSGVYLNQRGRYTDAKPLLERALAIWEKVLGPDHPHVEREIHRRQLKALWKRLGQGPTSSLCGHKWAHPLGHNKVTAGSKSF